jgi:hypothetical protein
MMYNLTRDIIFDWRLFMINLQLYLTEGKSPSFMLLHLE